MADINIQEVTNHINIETANGYNLEFNGPVVNMNVVLSNYYTKTETDALLNDKADKADTYTKSETNILLNDKADKADTYTISQINDMVQNINTAVDTKQNIITGAASTITNSNLTSNRAVISNASGKVAVSNVTSTELEYLSGVTSGIQTQLNAKASTSLDNLSADGQMIIDSQNGTISNCVLEIPQNLKMEISGSNVIVKAGSIGVRPNNVYQTYTFTTDYSFDYSSTSDGTYFFMVRVFSGGPSNIGLSQEKTVSGPTDSLAGTPYHTWFDTTKLVINRYSSDPNNPDTASMFPFALINVTNGIPSFAKDSNGNDMIFNGAGFIGHHAFVYPNVKALLPDGFNDDGSLKSIGENENALRIVEIQGIRGFFAFSGATGTVVRRPSCFEVNNLDELYAKNLQGFYYVKSINQSYSWGGGSGALYPGIMVFIGFSYDGTTVTDFTIRQPVRMATVEMLNSALGDIETLLATV